jgi:tetratricopeptide (TPR) repeat protein
VTRPSEPATLAAESSAAQLDLAFGLLKSNDAAGALLCAKRAAELDDRSALAWLVVGTAQGALGRPEPAVEALERSIEIDPDCAAAHFSLGLSCLDLDRLASAETHLRRALQLDAANKEALAALSTLYCRVNRFDAARECALRALKLDPGLLEAHQNLAGIFAQEGREDEARRHRDLAYGQRNLFVATAPDPVQRVLLLMSTDSGNVPDRHLLPADRYTRIRWFVEYAAPDQMNALPPYDVVFNAIADADLTERSSRNVAGFMQVCARPVLNHPDRIQRTRRDLMSALLADIDGVATPQTARIEPETLAAHGLAQAAKRSGIKSPWLVRPIGSHGGQGLVLVPAAGEAAVATAASAPRLHHYITHFHDYRSPDGLYRKYRVIFVDRRPYPYHLAIGPDWMVHYETSGTAVHPERLAEERRFLEGPESALGNAALSAVRAIGERLDLDFCGLDFSVLSDGRVLVFEANATMLVHPEAADGPLAHKNLYVEPILTAFRAMLARAQ